MVNILHRSPGADHGEGKTALHYTDNMFDLCTGSRLIAIRDTLFITEKTMPITFLLCEVPGQRISFGDNGFLAGIGQVAQETGFVTMRKSTQYRCDVYVYRRSHNVMDQLCPAVDANVGLNVEVSLIMFARLVHLRVVLFFLVLGRTGRIYNCGTDHSGWDYLHSVLLEVLIDHV